MSGHRLFQVLIDLVEKAGGGEPFLVRAHQQRKVLGHEAGLDGVDRDPLQGGGEFRQFGIAVELGAVREWYAPHLERVHEDAALRSADLDQLEQIAAGYPTRERFLTELTLDPPDAVSDEAGVPLLDEDYLILSTIHSSKGQEWTSVFVLNDPVEDAAAIAAVTAEGFLVRTRADADNIEPFDGETARRDAALASGAQLISTDYPAPVDGVDYVATIPGGTPSRCNPVTAPAGCTSADVESLDP